MNNNIGDIVKIEGLLFKHRTLIVTGYRRNMINVTDMAESSFTANINADRITENKGRISDKAIQTLSKKIIAKLRVAQFTFKAKEKSLTSIELMKLAKQGNKQARIMFLKRYGKLIK